MRLILEHFGSQSKSLLLIRAYITLAIISIIDFVLGRDLSALIFYFFPIIIIAWYVGRKQALYISVVSSSVAMILDLIYISSSDISGQAFLILV